MQPITSYPSFIFNCTILSLSLCNSRNVSCFKHFTGTRHCTRNGVWRSRQGECVTDCRMQNKPCLFDRSVILSPQIHLLRFPLVLWLNDTSMCDCFSHIIAPPHILNSVTLNFTLFHTFWSLFHLNPSTNHRDIANRAYGLFWHDHIRFRPKPWETPLKFTG